jgi:two-component system sensor histidine kinase CiaH
VNSLFRSALFKLTAVYVGLVMALSIAFSFMLYRLAVNELRTGFQNQYIRWLTEYQPYGLRQPGNPATELAARSHHIYAELVYFNILVLILTAIASYLLARRTLRPIERAHEQQKRFTADVSHELRTPLTALTMDTEVSLMDKKAPAAELRKTLHGNLEEAERMKTLINNLLQLASLEANQLRTEFTQLNVKDIAKNAIKVVERLADSKHIKFTTNLHDGTVAGDGPSLTQLFVILLENAVKYSPENSTVRVATSTHGRSVRFIVEDEGPGIPADALPHVFDRFYRADEARVSPKQTNGFGLGLSLAKLIADLHGAEIVLSSSVDKGTRALVRLPAASKNNT